MDPAPSGQYVPSGSYWNDTKNAASGRGVRTVERDMVTGGASSMIVFEPVFAVFESELWSSNVLSGGGLPVSTVRTSVRAPKGFGGGIWLGMRSTVMFGADVGSVRSRCGGGSLRFV
ncbi:MAG: hypothetical protein ACXWP4_19020 [Polyangiales bacterium]